jgi:hypothetical protein
MRGDYDARKCFVVGMRREDREDHGFFFGRTSEGQGGSAEPIRY